MRRVHRRMQVVELEGFDNYQDYLEVHPEEFMQLFNTILINVTAFFRDPLAWDYLSQEVIPSLLAGKKAGEPIRAWSAGCASGEEAYTLAMMLAEAVGIETFREQVKVYATEVDEEALAQARQGSFSARAVQAIATSRPTRRRRSFCTPRKSFPRQTRRKIGTICSIPNGKES